LSHVTEFIGQDTARERELSIYLSLIWGVGHGTYNRRLEEKLKLYLINLRGSHRSTISPRPSDCLLCMSHLKLSLDHSSSSNWAEYLP